MPKKNIPIGVSNFAKLVNEENNYLFSDKSLLIKEIIDDKSEVTLITRPRRWGKTLNMSMLYYFLANEVYTGEKAQGLFDNLLIAKVDDGKYLQYRGKYPVIFITFKDVKGDSFNNILNNLKTLIQELFREHEYLLKSEKLSPASKGLFVKHLTQENNPEQLEKSIKLLSELLYKHYGQKVYILIDEYDTPLNTAYNKEFFEKLTNFLKNLFSAALKDNDFLQKGIMTGILRISKDNMLSGLNNPKVNSLLDKGYKDCFGFTEMEVKALFEAQDLAHEMDAISQYYNGYKVADAMLYNPWSIMCCLDNKGEIKPYWVNTADDSLLKEVLQEANAEIKVAFQSLLEKKSVTGLVSETIRFDNLKENETSVWSLLLYAGYLTAKSVTSQRTKHQCLLAIPNDEVLALYKDILIEWLNQPSKEMQLKCLLKNLLQGHIKKFASDIQDFLKTAASFHDYAKQPEAFYHGFMLALTASLMDSYYVDSNKESGLGRPDLLFIPKDNKISKAIILEFKHVHKNEDPEEIAREALAQIDEQAYTAKIKAYVYIKDVLKVGLAFDGKEVYYEYKETPIEKLFSVSSQANSSDERSLIVSPIVFDKEGDEEEPEPAVEKKAAGKRKREESLSPILFDDEGSEKSTPPNKKKQRQSYNENNFFTKASTSKEVIDNGDSEKEKHAPSPSGSSE